MNYFPVSLATGKAFCNRRNELQRIHYNLEQHIATLLVSPRRYGKTSLALQAFEKIKWPYSHIDLYKALSADDVAQFILSGIGHILGQIESSPKKLMTLAKEFFSGFQLSFSIEDVGIAVEFTGKRQKMRPVELILTALEKIDRYVLKKKKHAVIFLDEFQILAEIIGNNSIEAALREAVQKSKAICYIFSGSNRHLIESMFNDSKRPFYNLCDQMHLKRIDTEHYKPYINKAAEDRWKKKLPIAVIDTILTTVERHSYYVNKLCSLLWQQKTPPIIDDVLRCWNAYVMEHQAVVQKELGLLPVNQRKVLINLALDHGVNEPFGQTCAALWGMSSTSIHRAMEALIEKDYVHIGANGYYQVLDPLFSSAINSK